MKQALSQLAARARRSARATAGAAPALTRRSRAAAGPATDRSSLCVRATLLFARWQRCGQGRIGLAMGCVCAGEAAIDVALLDGMILDHLLQRFAGQARLHHLLGSALSQADQGQRALAELLQTLAQPHHGLRPREWSDLLDALHTSIASIEEHRGIA
ncbi:MAG: hypothetical protein WCK08_15420 [Betaproteobacteria bacterium]